MRYDTLEVEADVSESAVEDQRRQPSEITLDALPDVRFRAGIAHRADSRSRQGDGDDKVRFEISTRGCYPR